MNNKKMLVTAAALGLLASAARANPPNTSPMDLYGSDTLHTITTALINHPSVALSGSLRYVGGGSSTGGQRMSPTLFGANGHQQISPQSRFLNSAECSQCKNGNGVCTATGPTATNRGQGYSVALDGIALWRDKTEASTCRVIRYAGCMEVLDLNDRAVLGYGNGAPGIDDGTGAGVVAQLFLSDGPDADGQLDHYCFTHWADALRIIYTGQHKHLNDSSAAAACNNVVDLDTGAVANKRCNSDVRRTLVENWANIFDTEGGGGDGGCTDGHCSRLKHAFRRDDFSGTTDAFLALIGAPSLTTAFNVRSFCNGIENEDLDIIRRPCNFNTNATNDPDSVCAPIPFANRNTPIGADGSPSGAAGACNWAVNPPTGANCPVPPPAGTTANPTVGDLGLVLAISLPTQAAFQYDNTFCTGPIGGAFKLAQAPAAVAPNAQRCPNGQARLGGQCLAPVYSTGASAGRFNCKMRRVNRAAGGAWSTNYDARAHNLIPRNPATGEILQPNSTVITDPRWGGGGHYRIHMALPKPSQTTTPLAAVHPACTLVDATEQIGCLVESDPCSIGYAGLAADDDPTTTGGSVALGALVGTNESFLLRAPLGTGGEVDVSVPNVRRLIDPQNVANCADLGDYDIRYSLARILWLNASKGFGPVGAAADLSNITDTVITGDGTAGNPVLTTNEQNFVEAYLDRTIMDPIAAANGFITLSDTPGTPTLAQRFRQCP
jgi:hypothetical protein